MMKTSPFMSGKGALALVAAVAAFGAGSASAGEGAIAPVTDAKICETYVVAAGDTLGKIALEQTGDRANAETIFRMNGYQISDINDIDVGMQLMMPCEGAAKPVSYPAKAAVTSWSAQPGDKLIDVLAAWGTAEGYVVMPQPGAPTDWTFEVPFSGSESFRTSVEEAVAGFKTASYPPVVVFYTNNVLSIGVK